MYIDAVVLIIRKDNADCNVLFIIMLLTYGIWIDIYSGIARFPCDTMALVLHFDLLLSNTIRYDTLEEFNVDSKADYTALSGTRIQKLQESRAAARKPRDAASVLFR